MYIEIISVSKKKETDTLPDRRQELSQTLNKYGFTLNDVKKTLLNSTAINSTLNKIVKSDSKPDVVIITNALRTKDSKSFKKYFVETVVAAERGESEPVPKDYWKKRNKVIKEARIRKAPEEEIKKLEDSFLLTRKKAKVFSLGDFGNKYKGYCFMYKGVRVAAVPKEELTGHEINEIIALAAARTTEIFENSANDYPDGFSEVKYEPEKTGFVNRYIPLRSDSKKEVARKCVVIAAFMVFLAALGLLFYNMIYLSLRNAQINGEIQRIAHGYDEEGDGEGKNKGIDWDALKRINKEIVGWLKVDKTQIDYPVLWHKGDDMNSQYYLDHNYKNEYDSYGSVFLDYRCKNGTDCKNVVLHAHHMNDGSMFGNLMNYGGTTGNLEFYQKVPLIEFDTPKANGKYKIISVFKTNTLSSHGEFFNYMIGDFQNEKDFMNYVYNVRIRSLINCPVTVNEDDELITLSTCSYEYTNFRTVVVARKVRIGESEKVDVKKASLNSGAVWPQVYYSSMGGTRPKVTDFTTEYLAKNIKWYDGKFRFKDQKVQVTDGHGTTAPPTTKAATTSGSTSGSTGSSTAGTRSTTKPVVYCTVKFINYDGSKISEQKVEYGKAAKKPKDPVKPSDTYYDYIFKGWQLDFSKVTYNMVIAPKFEPKLKPQYAQ
ncbi:MAG TPA: SrtB family sortase [Ruminococcaceae bacterium]|nr:SrtB family sortase [Oscillospiraceae bacterium]